MLRAFDHNIYMEKARYKFLITIIIIISGAPRAKRASGAPWVNKSTHSRKFGNHVTDRPTVRPHHVTDRPTVRPHHRKTNAKFQVVCECIVFGAKTKGRPRFVKHKQLKSSAKSTQKKEIFRIGWAPCNSAILDILLIMSSSLEYKDRERQRKRESRRQASQAQRETKLLWRAAG